MWHDAKPSSHSVVVKNINDVVEIIGFLDGIVYSKGVSIFRMVEQIIGSEEFRIDLQNYLLTNAFDVGNLNTLYNQFFTYINGTEFMKTWLEEPNYPLLNVSLNVENGNTKLKFTQSRFIVSDALNSSHLDKNYRWKINLQCVLGRLNRNSSF